MAKITTITHAKMFEKLSKTRITNINRLTEGRRVGVKEKEEKIEYIKHIQWFYL